MAMIRMVKGNFEIGDHVDGLIVTGEPTKEDWIAFGETLRRAKQRIQFAMGDWIVYGERYCADSLHAADEAVAILGWTRKTVSVYRWLASSVPIGVRRSDLSVSHHLAVAALHPRRQVEWLAKAAKNKWPVGTLKRAITLGDDSEESASGIFVITGSLSESDYKVVSRVLRKLGATWRRVERRRRHAAA